GDRGAAGHSALGWGCLLLGVLGVLLPILPGMPFLLLGAALLGRRDRALRWCSARGKLALRRWAALERPLVGAVGRWALRQQRQASRRRRRLAWRYRAWRRAGP
ncbi:MAG TPA: hypothetical protein VFW96_15740, partial [Thermomicrobiales bacterium]|nr:hypothetical protein [Thermomicrobiales bacterium]